MQGNIMKIIYVHGFNSGGNTEKVRILRTQFDDVVAPDLPHTPGAAIALLADLIEASADDNIVLVGSSLGGFYAHYLSKEYGLKCVLINPSINPVETLKRHIGHHTNYVTGVEYDFTEADVYQTAKFYVDPADDPVMPTLVCLDMGDELLDSAATAEAFKATAKVITFDGGNHRFTHMDDILPEIAKLEHVVYQS